MSERRIQRWVNEGRGQGYEGAYKPWLTIRDVPSTGFVHRVIGRKSGRIHHLLSYLEFMVFLHYDMQPLVVDIREQYPLERTATREIAKRHGVRHPIYPYTNIPLVMTTDILVTLKQEDKVNFLARAVKPSVHLANARTAEKLRIEFSYWQEKGEDWGVITERDIPKWLTENLYRMRFAHSLDQHPGFTKAQGRDLQRYMLELIPRNGDSSYAQFCSAFERLAALSAGDAHFLLTNLMLHGVVTTDLHQPWSVRRTLDQFIIVPSALDGLLGCDD